MTDLACIGLGSNQGNRLDTLRAGLRALAGTDGITLHRVSSAYESDPVGYVDQPAFLNAAATLTCSLSPHRLLAALMAVESALGRQRTVLWGPRTLDLDLLLWGSRVVHTPDLVLPHPRMVERDFVLVPLLEIAPDLHHPVTGRSLAAHAAETGPCSNLRRTGVLWAAGEGA